MSLLIQAAIWLRKEKDCPLVLTERSPRHGMGQPDVLGITDHRYLLEIEIKESMADFRANKNKFHIRNREALGDSVADRFPKQFWFLVPPKLAEKVHPEVPAWAGLLTLENDKWSGGWSTLVKSVKKAPVNNASRKLSLKEAARLMRNVGNELFSLRIANSNMRQAGYVLDAHHMDSFYSTKLVPAPNGFGHHWVPNPDYLNFQI